MRKLILSLGTLTMGILMFTSCQKKTETAPETLSPEFVSTQASLTSNLSNAKSLNDSIIHYHNIDSTMANGMCNYYDNLYHHNDSLFTAHYNKCNQMITNGTMMTGNNGTNGNNGMMGGNGGMMESSGQNMMNNHSALCTQQNDNINQMMNQITTIRNQHATFHKDRRI